MICLGKSLGQNPQSMLADKENNPHHHNLIQKDPLLKKTQDAPKLGLHKQTSQHSTDFGSIIDVEDYGLQLKRHYSQQVALDYADDIFQSISSAQLNTQACLSSHTISPTLRSRMVDWMIEVLSSYKMSEQSYFKSVFLMDSYLKQEKATQTNKSIHLIGISCMFIATKYEQIYPLRLRHMAQKISRNKFIPQQIIDKESKIIETLNFNLEFSTVFDVVKFLYHQIKMAYPRSSDYFYRILVYLSKMCMFDEEIACLDKTLLGSAIYFIGLKTLEQVESMLVPEQILCDVASTVGIPQFQIINIGRSVLNLAKNYSRLYPQFTNLKKFNKFTFPTS